MKKLLIILTWCLLLLGLMACSHSQTITQGETILMASHAKGESFNEEYALYFKETSTEITNTVDYNKFINYINSMDFSFEPKDLGSIDFNNQHLIIYPLCCEATSIEYDDIQYENQVISGQINYTNTCYKKGSEELGYTHIGNTYYSVYFLLKIALNVNPADIMNNIEMVNDDYDGPIIDRGEEYIVYKPIMYIYPTEKIHLNIRFQDTAYLKTTYPKYTHGWDIWVDTDGTITDCDNKHYYALYYDEICHYMCSFQEGFYVTADEAIDFLEEKLMLLGFSEREMNEFIMYWLPVLEQNGYSKVYFEQTMERNVECPLIFNHKIDSMLRVIIHIQKIEYDDMKNPLKEEVLNTFVRKGNTIVEWGGVSYEEQ